MHSKISWVAVVLSPKMSWALIGPPQDLVSPLLEVLSAAPCRSFVDIGFSTALRHAPLVLLAVLQFYMSGVDASEAQESCSKVLGFNETSGPKDRSNQDLQFCTEHHKRTCCERNHTRQVLATFGAHTFERSARCSQMSRLALCSLCDGDVGSGQKASGNLILLCPSFCSRWFNACIEDFFAPDGTSAGRLQACTPSSLACSPLGEIVQDAASFCRVIGDFAVADVEDDALSPCYDGVPAASSRGKGPRAHWARPQPPGKPWYRKILDHPTIRAIRYSSLSYQIQANAPAIIMAFVAIFFFWYLWRSED